MKKTIKLAVVAALALGATSAFATNGSTMVGAGAKTRGMAGVGIGMSHGAESTLNNPALITTVESSEVSFGGTIFMPDVESTNTLASTAGVGPTNTTQSAADFYVVPSISIVTKINDNFYAGIGMWGTGGLGVDYRDSALSAVGGSQMQMVTALSLMQFGVPLAYKMDNFSAALTPVIQYGTLDINYANPMASDATVGTGVGSDISMGYTFGLSYETNGLTLGAVYKSEIEMKYDNVLSTAVGAMTGGAYTNDVLSVPAEYGLGLSYKTGEHTIAIDYKLINWESADGYKDFGWEDQDVIAVGYEYATDVWAIRLGYSDANSAVKDNTGKNLALDGMLPNLSNTFNALGFPGNIETHYALGGTYNVTKAMSVDLAYVYAPEATTSYATNFSGQPISVKHSETSYSLQVNLAF